MTPKEKPIKEDKKLRILDEICENTRPIRRVTNRIRCFLVGSILMICIVIVAVITIMGQLKIPDRLIRYIEDLDSVRDRAAVTQEELVNRLSEQVNTRMYVLSLVAAVFLPLGFLAGLLGIDVGGIPGAENQSAFLIFILLLILVFILQVVIFKRRSWL
jgi:hypothetical protein